MQEPDSSLSRFGPWKLWMKVQTLYFSHIKFHVIPPQLKSFGRWPIIGQSLKAIFSKITFTPPNILIGSMYGAFNLHIYPKNQVSIPFFHGSIIRNDLKQQPPPRPPASVETNRGQANWATMKPAETVASDATVEELRRSPVVLWVIYTICYYQGLENKTSQGLRKTGFYNIYHCYTRVYRKQKTSQVVASTGTGCRKIRDPLWSLCHGLWNNPQYNWVIFHPFINLGQPGALFHSFIWCLR